MERRFFVRGDEFMEKYSRDGAIALLQAKYKELCDSPLESERRYPKRSDFTDIEVSMIKSFFGPWPRALEASGIKEPRADDRIEKNREKRIAAKRRRRENGENKGEK